MDPTDKNSRDLQEQPRNSDQKWVSENKQCGIARYWITVW